MKVKYGYIFGDEVTDFSIELHFYRVSGDPEVKAFHLENAWRIGFPEKTAEGKPGYIWSPWTTRRIRAWCGCDDRKANKGRYQTWWGPSSSGKTEDVGLLCLLHWLSAPDQTAIHLTSTSGKMLKRRIWGAVTKYYLLYGEDVFPGRLKVAETCIVFSEANLKAGIFGHAIERGEEDKAVNNIIGVHNLYNVLVVDEMQGTPEAVGSSRVLQNLSVGREFKFIGMGNPMSRLDLLGSFSEPVTGWDTLSPENECWETKRGMCHYFDGLKSPGIKDPDRYPFLLKQAEIDEAREHDGEGSPDWWTMRRGFMPPEGLLSSMITESMLVEGHCFEETQWGEDAPQVVIGFDPAYASGGDRCMGVPVYYGVDKDGIMRLQVGTPRQIKLELAENKTMLTSISTQATAILGELAITADNASVDCTAMQGLVADGIEERVAGRVYRVYFGGSANDSITVSAIDTRTGKKAYKNRTTQLMGHLAQYIKSGMIRALPREIAKEVCLRRVVENVSPIRIEEKKDYKSRHGASPDVSDALLVAVAMIREKLHIIPEGKRYGSEPDQSTVNRDIDSWGDNWQNP